MATMALFRRPTAVYVPFDARAAQAWDRMGFTRRFLVGMLDPQKAAFMRQQHALWRSWAAQQPQVKQPNPMLLSQQLRRR